MSKITSPVLIIHGTEDEVIDFSHGLALYERCPKAVEPLWVEGAGHNDIELYSQYLERLRRFISQELPSQQLPTPRTDPWLLFSNLVTHTPFSAKSKKCPLPTVTSVPNVISPTYQTLNYYLQMDVGMNDCQNLC